MKGKCAFEGSAAGGFAPAVFWIWAFNPPPAKTDRRRYCDTLPFVSRYSIAAAALLLAPVAFAQETPLTSLLYTPSLETRFIDRSADPCVDFYKFACGKWNSLNPIPADQPRWDVYSKLGQENQRF